MLARVSALIKYLIWYYLLAVSKESNNVKSARSTAREWGIPASISWYGNYVVIGGRELSKRLEGLYLSGVREVEVVLDVPGQRLVVGGKIYKRQRSHAYYFIYPKHSAQALLRELYFMHRGDAGRYAKRPIYAVVVAIVPVGKS
jgi:hypothetical protein